MAIEFMPHAEGVVLSVKVRPGAKRSAVLGSHAGGLKIAVAAPPVDGKANAALIEFLCEEFGLKRSQIAIVRGARTREKHVLIRELSSEDAQKLFADFAK